MVIIFFRKLCDGLRVFCDLLFSGIVYGCRVFVKKIHEGVKEISRHYSKVDQHWEETTVTRVVSESEVPSEILERARANEELDITDELEMQLESA